MDTLDLKLVRIALEHVTGADFENFFNAFYPSIAGIEFVPLGGVHDGGADAFQDRSVFEGKGQRPGVFYQASIEKNFQRKIRTTVQRLKQVGRNPTSLLYVTPKIIKLIDMVEEKLSNELKMSVRIRDGKWIVGHINHSRQTIAAFKSYLLPHLSFMKEIGGNTLITPSPNIPVRTMCVFLGQEIDRRRDHSDLVIAVTDSLILWALEGTDPAKKRFMNRTQIRTRIETVLPAAMPIITRMFDHRLETLALKGNTAGREVRWYRKEDKFCLPFKTRLIVAQENTVDELLKLKVINTYEQRAEVLLTDSDKILPNDIAKIAHRTIELTFESKGLELVEFLSDQSNEEIHSTIADKVDTSLCEIELSSSLQVRAKEVTLSVLRQAFYRSTETERVYYGKLSRTYVLFFTLRNEPRIVDYFRQMSSDLVLFVGSDVIIRALSERYLAEEDQMTVNMLNILSKAGSTLILTPAAVNEVQGHLFRSNIEFMEVFSDLEPHVDREIASHSNRILIRAYFYAKFDDSVNIKPRSWKSYIGQVCNYQDLQYRRKSRIQIQHYLVERFGFIVLEEEDLDQIIDFNQVEDLTTKLVQIKQSEFLARNDAQQILAVYGKRVVDGETKRANPYGYRVWWLTHETRVLQFTKHLVAEFGANYIMRPEFLMNFIALSPTLSTVRKNYESIFPTLLGIKLSNRMREELFNGVMREIREVREVDEARAIVKMSELSNQLKGDNYKKYEASLLSHPSDLG